MNMSFRVVLVVLLSMVLNSSVYAQKTPSLISINGENKSIKELLLEIEQQTSYRFYFANEWLTDKTISTSFNNKRIEEILNVVFEGTSINFYIDSNKRIILTQNSTIYTKLPEGFFTDTLKNNEPALSVAPIFLEKSTTSRTARIETVRIGRENLSARTKEFTLSGIVRNSKNDTPIPNLTIVVRKISRGTVTNSNGYYELKLPAGINLVETSLLGFENIKKNVVLYNSGSLNFTVDETFEELDEVVLEVDSFQNIEDTTTGSSKISSEESKNIPLVLGERDVLKIATTLPGVTTAGEGAAGFNVRGGKTDQNLILLNDAVVYNPSHFFGIFQALNPFAIKDVNIYKGSIPAEYGGRLSSVFDIRTKQPSNEKVKAELAIGPVTSNAVVEIPVVKNKAGLLIGGRGAYSNWILRSLDEDNLKNSEASFYDFIANYNHKIDEKNNLEVTGYYSKDKFSITSDSLYSYSNRLASLKWNHTFNEKHHGSLSLHNSQYKFNIDFDGSINSNFSQNYQIDETELKLRMDYALNDTHALTYGVTGKLYSVLPGEISPQSANDLITPTVVPKEKGLEGAIFISDDIKVNEKLQLDVGLRYSFFAGLGPSSQRVYQEGVPRSDNTVINTEIFDNNEVFETYGGPEARVSARYLINDDLSIKASFNNTYQFIHTLSNNTTVSPIDTWKLSDSNIEPQQASQVSLGIYKNININAYEFSLEGFYKKQQNILDFKTGAQLLLNENVETEVLQGEGKSYGVEFLVRKNKGKLNGWLGYTYSRSLFKLDSEFNEERVNDGEFFPSNFDKPHDVSLVLNYKLSQRISLSSNFIYQTGRPVTFPVGNFTFGDGEFVLYSDRNKFRVPDYYRLDLGINFEGNHKKKKLFHSFWSLSIYNVLGRNNPYSVFFVTDNGEVKALQSSIFAVPVPSITYNIKF